MIEGTDETEVVILVHEHRQFVLQERAEEGFRV